MREGGEGRMREKVGRVDERGWGREDERVGERMREIVCAREREEGREGVGESAEGRMRVGER